MATRSGGIGIELALPKDFRPGPMDVNLLCDLLSQRCRNVPREVVERQMRRLLARHAAEKGLVAHTVEYETWATKLLAHHKILVDAVYLIPAKSIKGYKRSGGR